MMKLNNHLQTGRDSSRPVFFPALFDNSRLHCIIKVTHVRFYCLYAGTAGERNLAGILRSHAGELYQIYRGFFEKGLLNKYSRFYNDVKTAEPEIADRFMTEFLKTEIRAYETEFESLVDPVNPDTENPDDAATLRDVCRRVEVFFESGTDRRFY